MERTITKPECRIRRGYDTFVKISPPNGDYEISRTVTVYCSVHNLSAILAFNTANMDGQEISDQQAIAFDQCFAELEKRCHKMIQDNALPELQKEM